MHFYLGQNLDWKIFDITPHLDPTKLPFDGAYFLTIIRPNLVLLHEIENSEINPVWKITIGIS